MVFPFGSASTLSPLLGAERVIDQSCGPESLECR